MVSRLVCTLCAHIGTGLECKVGLSESNEILTEILSWIKLSTIHGAMVVLIVNGSVNDFNQN